LGIAQILKTDREETDVFLSGAKYAAPENGLRMRASEKSLVFQLGILFYALLTGEHPFAKIPITENLASVEEENIVYLLPTILGEVELPEKFLSDEETEILVRMLKKNPEERPTLNKVMLHFQNYRYSGQTFPLKKRKENNRKEKNTILFPARMGLPHKGHIEYIARLINLGYHVRISIQRAYTITENDPIPKWLVMKIVAASLLEQGFSRESFSFMLTPFYETDREHRLHFAMMPGAENVIGVASGNHAIDNLFDQYRIIDQNAVFGQPEQTPIDRSWGKILRAALTQNDYATFIMLAASGTESIISFAEIRAIYGKPKIDFVSGYVQAILLNRKGEVIAHGKISRYQTPEEALIRSLKNSGKACELIDSYCRDTKVRLESKRCSFKYLATAFNDGKEMIYYQIS
jgi:hypothetical protein